MGGEARLWTRLQARVSERFLVQRIENLVGDGVPDVHLVSRANGSQHWWELKCRVELPKRATTRVFGDEGLRVEQIPWLWSRAQAGASVWILAQAGDWLFLVYGSHARVFNEWTLGELQANCQWVGCGKLTGEAISSLCDNMR